MTLAGAVDLSDKGLGRQEFLRAFFDGSKAQRPQRWAQSDPFALAKEHHQVPVTVVHGTGDTTVNPAVARAFAKALRHGGVDTHLVEVPDADHLGVLVAPAATEAIVAATDATAATKAS